MRTHLSVVQIDTVSLIEGVQVAEGRIVQARRDLAQSVSRGDPAGVHRMHLAVLMSASDDLCVAIAALSQHIGA